MDHPPQKKKIKTVFIALTMHLASLKLLKYNCLCNRYVLIRGNGDYK